MRAMDLIWLACLRAYLGTLKPKERLAYLKAVSDIVGDPGVTILAPKEIRGEVADARASWAKLLPKMVA